METGTESKPAGVSLAQCAQDDHGSRRVAISTRLGFGDRAFLPLIDDSFGTFDSTKSPITCVFGTLSVRPSVDGLSQYRYFRYPNGEEHVYDLIADPGETTNIAPSAPLEQLREELVKGALDLGLDLRGFENPADWRQRDDGGRWHGGDGRRTGR